MRDVTFYLCTVMCTCTCIETCTCTRACALSQFFFGTHANLTFFLGLPMFWNICKKNQEVDVIGHSLIISTHLPMQ